MRHGSTSPEYMCGNNPEHFATQGRMAAAHSAVEREMRKTEEVTKKVEEFAAEEWRRATLKHQLQSAEAR
eukprot:3212907-Rhodomonas_salina.1